MVKILAPYGWMAGHDVLMWANQCAYIENLHTRNPEYVTLWQKPEEVFATGTSLMLSGVQDDLYFAWEDGKIYRRADWVNVCTVADGWNIYNLKRVGNYYYFSRSNANTSKLARVLITEAQSGTDRTAETSYSDDYTAWGNMTSMQKTLFKGSEMLSAQDDDIYLLENDSGGTATLQSDLWSFVWDVVWFWQYWQDTKAVTTRWQYSFITVDWSNTLLRFPHNTAMMAWFTVDWWEYIISGTDNDNSAIYQPNGYGKSIIAQATSTANIESKEKFYFGRANEIASRDEATTKMWGDDVVASYNNIIYMIAKDKVISLGTQYRGQPLARDYTTSVNDAGDATVAIWFVKWIVDSHVPYLYYSRENAAGNCGVSKIKMQLEPTLYHSQWVEYTRKFVFDWDKAGITQIKMRAYTTATQTIKVYIALDWWSYELVDTLDSTDPKEYHLLNKNYEGYECQFKFVYDTSDTSVTPRRYSFDFVTTIFDG